MRASSIALKNEIQNLQVLIANAYLPDPHFQHECLQLGTLTIYQHKIKILVTAITMNYLGFSNKDSMFFYNFVSDCKDQNIDYHSYSDHSFPTKNNHEIYLQHPCKHLGKNYYF